MITLKTTQVQTYTPDRLSVRVDPVLRIQGYRDLSRVRPRVRKIAWDMVQLATEQFAPVAVFRNTRAKKLDSGQLTLANGQQLECPAFDRFLPGCERIVVFALTVGEKFDQTLRDFQSKEQMVEALLFDAAGWMGVESLAKQFAQQLRVLAGESGLKLTRRLAPGYSFKVGGNLVEWPLTDQIALFDVFEGETIPIQLMESCAMLPSMSRSGLFGLHAKTL